MAANPKLPPDERNLQDDHAHLVITRKRASSWPLILVIIAAVVLIALIAWVVLSKPRRTSVTLPNQDPVIQQVLDGSARAVLG